MNELFCKLDRISLIMWCSCNKSVDDVDFIEKYNNGLVKVWMKDGSMFNLKVK
jgi:hypothetical protein